MTIRKKMWIDSRVGYPLLFLLGFLFRLSTFFKINQIQDRPIRKILITKYQGMGSLVIAASAIQRLRKAFPAARIIFLGTETTALLASKMNEFDEVLTLKDSSLSSAMFSWLKILIQLRREQIDCSFDLEVYSSLAALLSASFGAKKRVGFIYRSSSSRKFIYTDLVFFNRENYLAKAYWKLFATVSIPAFENQDLKVYNSWKLTQPRSDLILPKRYVVLNIHTSPLSLERKWPKSSFEKWAKRLLSDNQEIFLVLLGHGPQECEEVRSFFDHPRILKFAGLLNLDEVFHCISKAQLMISNDSGPLHFANSLGTPAIGLFGPTQAHHYFEAGQKHVSIIQKETYCSPCVHHWDRPPCKGDNQCMKKISWQDLWNASSSILKLSSLITSTNYLESLDSDYFAGRFYK